ncbi:MAG: bifunctional alpha/beta hydrolase/OsmC family protein [Pseudomonadota bacterium]|uniref:bifunctional alpha/beta hydrolase/OsmC family protein n=1 Tax=unclassified Phenylobacterium TaxID=2640670 RepID=UPI0006F206CF|nr:MULTISPECIES: bifunctional alpha/beta hydrolase/OsmC family protein [unclassified Phenylobacterium]KRB40460.1 osmotically inducible protein C [Phenylobacterium sp. Root700]MBT9473231.1 OsmC family protein [Phenylobacterium sp.]
MSAGALRVEFPGHSGATLAARLDLPNGPVRAFALFAHCFTCSKDLMAARRIAADLAREGVAVLRFDFTGLGSSEGEFASTNFTSNVADLIAAADYLRGHYQAPSVLIGHSLGGAAVLAVAKDIAEVRAVVTIGAPFDPSHVLHNLGSSLQEIEEKGQAQVVLGLKTFTIRRQFVEDVRRRSLREAVASMKKPLLILHSPLDQLVGVDNATRIFLAAKHPKSFVSLDHADHFLSDPKDAAFAAQVIAGWLPRYLTADAPQGEEPVEHVRVMETGVGRFQNMVQAGRHRLFADEPESVGGSDTGPSPYDFLSIALGACTSMTLRLYAERKQLDLGRIQVEVSHKKLHVQDGAAGGEDGKIDCFNRVISVDADMPQEMRAKLVEIAGKCPVHRTLEARSKVETQVRSFDPA